MGTTELPRRVAFVLPGFPRQPGGGHQVVYEYANFMVNAGVDVTVLHLRVPKQKDELQSRLRRVSRAAAGRIFRQQRPAWFELDRRVRVVNAGRLDVRVVPDVDVLVATAVGTAPFVASVVEGSRAAGAYFLQHFEDFGSSSMPVEDTWRLPLHKIAVSEWLRKKALAFGETAVVVPNAVDHRVFFPGAPIVERAPSVLALISPVAWKRSDLVGAVYSELRSARPDVQLRTFGVGSQWPGMPAEVQHFERPSRRDLAHLYRQSRVFLSTSDSEGFGLPVAEALACRAAVISTDNGGATDLLNDRRLLAPRGDGSALFDAVMRAVDHPEATAQACAEAWTRVSQWSSADAGRAFLAALTTAWMVKS